MTKKTFQILFIPMFCECGTILHLPVFVNEKIVCHRCSCVIGEYSSEPYVAVKKYIKKDVCVEKEVKGAKIKMECVKCGNNEMHYNSAQLRSADEGQTLFYTCVKCGYRETVHG